MYRIISFLFLTLSSFGSAQDVNSLNDLLATPDWLSLSISHQSRFETLNNQFRAGRNGGDQGFVYRTGLKTDIIQNRWGATLELVDARVALVDSGSPVNGAIVNPLDILQASLRFNLNSDNSNIEREVLLGRYTMDFGSRRLIARNIYRNTMNAFSGIKLRWGIDQNQGVQAFISNPVLRRYDGNPLDNKPLADKALDGTRFWGFTYRRNESSALPRTEIFLLGLNEDDESDQATTNRDLTSLGARLLRPAATGQFDYELEAVYQTGHARATNSTADNMDLDHDAHFIHLESGYSFNAPLNPRLQIHYDFATGDKTPLDDSINTFDSLYGVPRGDYGPTSLYRTLNRENIRSPGIRFSLSKQPWSWYMELRDARLDSSEAPWIAAGLANPPGADETHIGSQIETRFRWQLVPGRVLLETGAAYLKAGAFMRNLGKSDAGYFYLQTNLDF